MRVFIIGGTGFLGSFLVPKLQRQGHEVTILTRKSDKASEFENLGIKTVVGDLFQPESFAASLDRQDVVISVAMPDITPGRGLSKRFNLLRDQTTLLFSGSISIARKMGCPIILTSGTSFRTKGEQVADENWPIERFGMAKIGEFTDSLIAELFKQGSPGLIQMLPGEIYGPGGLFKKFTYEWAKKNRNVIIGPGDNYIPRIHVEDCAEAYVKALEKMPIGEKYIIADDKPCTQKEFSDFLADCMSIPRPRSIPGLIVRLAMGKLIYETVTMNCRVCNTKAKRDLDWKLKYPTFREGLFATIQEIEKNEKKPCP